MPHQCTKCGKIFADGDVNILKGCECGNNKFLYIPKVKGREKEELEEQFEKIESVRIVAPGTYEINIEKLLERDEIIIALQENGRYAIHLPSLIKKKKRK
ncbi:Zn-ribbon domain-containing protein [Ferroglobus sp.]|uniref:Zn-ribbon domain-containing protein n=1 Tax=Ferroglobus sp. TaxID=2614230 RepID=UPI0025B83FC4|nr:Zn-ribbon domain-containing protein [Ferroglobus sp.]